MDPNAVLGKERVTPTLEPQAAGTVPPRREPRQILLGIVVGIGIPVAQILVAFAWDRGLISPEPNGPFVQSLQFGSSMQLLLGPIGVAIVGRAARLSWVLLIVVAIPLLAVLWFVGTAWLGGLAGEPF